MFPDPTPDPASDGTAEVMADSEGSAGLELEGSVGLELEGSAGLETVATIPPMDTWPTPDAPWRESGDDVDEVLQSGTGADAPSEGNRPAVEATDIDPAESEDGGDPGDPEVADDLESAEVDPAELDAIEAELGDIEIALDRLSDGSYGTCEACSRPIAEEQLRRNPASRRCAEHLPLPAA